VQTRRVSSYEIPSWVAKSVGRKIRTLFTIMSIFVAFLLFGLL